ncbi:hypothetical protein WN48_06637 [Eufriesea mexicana]|uniref:Uncharacterized protein n=1 Tax=Eufriesea mexicana TaxID=516756 RepID=A0A310SCE2_9HYME|nr:hypothetical protein WN48_06637 [Eufriesea mexicana]
MATPDPVDPATLEIKTRSIEQTLHPLVKQAQTGPSSGPPEEDEVFIKLGDTVPIVITGIPKRPKMAKNLIPKVNTSWFKSGPVPEDLLGPNGKSNADPLGPTWR